MDVTYFASTDELRAWFQEHHQDAQELWPALVKKEAGLQGVTYREALDQALCFGWIDGVRKPVDRAHFTGRFTPRKPNSNWSEVNIKRFRELQELGLVEPPGLAAFLTQDPARTQQYSYEERTRGLDPVYEARFREQPPAWDFFQSQAPWYQRTASWWVMSAKREETRLKRLATLMEDSARGQRIAPLIRQNRQR